jgi:DNA repair ATPase RecN
VFALGVLVVFVVRVRPQADQIRSLVRQSDEMQQELSTAQARVEELEPLQEQNEQLADQLAESEQHLDLLAVLVDVTNAQLALMQDQPGAAEAALDGTDARLESLQAGLDGQEADAVEGMRNRLGLVLEGLESDIFAAQRDLEIMANNLVELEQRMFQP